MIDRQKEIARQRTLATTRFADLLEAFRVGGFNYRESYDLRVCMERGWGFSRVAAALEKHGKALEYEDAEGFDRARSCYDRALGDLAFHYRNLIDCLNGHGFEESSGGKFLRSCLKNNYGFDDFRQAFARSGNRLEFPTVQAEQLAAACYESLLTHGKARGINR